MLTSANLSELRGIRHGFFTRGGGVSEGVYASLNCGPGSGDDLDKVMENRARVAQQLGATPERLVTAHQVHSAKVAIVDTPWKTSEAPQADALITNTPGIAMGVLTADCLPILMAAPEPRIVAAVHAGWKGAFDGVIDAAVAGMQQLGAETSGIVAALGPSIAQPSYEVGPEFHARFLQQDLANDRYFAPSTREGRHLFDLAGYAAMRLKNTGVELINATGHDTCALANDFFSYRRATLSQETVYGRQVSAILLEEK